MVDILKMPSMQALAAELEDSPEILRAILFTFSEATTDPSVVSLYDD